MIIFAKHIEKRKYTLFGTIPNTSASITITITITININTKSPMIYSIIPF